MFSSIPFTLDLIKGRLQHLFFLGQGQVINLKGAFLVIGIAAWMLISRWLYRNVCCSTDH
jgi:hypothetical protein